MIPAPWAFALLALAAFRIWKLLGDDVVTERARRAFVVWVSHDLKGLQDWADFVACPWCLGFWIVAVEWLLWLVWPHGVEVASVPFALSAGVGVVGQVIYALARD